MTEKSKDVKKEDAGKDGSSALLEIHVETALTDNTKATFLTSEDEEVRIKKALDDGVFVGFTKDELLKFERDPGWKRLRLVLLILFWFAWALLLLSAIVVIVLTPPCPTRPALQWPEVSPIYEINVPSFRIGSRCTDPPATSGNVEGIIDVLAPAPSGNYFDRLLPAETFWLRWDVFGKDISEDVGKLFEETRKRQRRILLDLSPYKPSSSPMKPGDLECGIFSGSKVRESAMSANVTCCNQDSDVQKMIEFINKFRSVTNGFVLDYNKWLLYGANQTTNDEIPLKKLIEAVTRSSSGEATTGDSAKHLIMRFPVLDKRFIEGADKNKLIEQRIAEEEIARKAGVRLIVETVAMNEADPEACSSIDCLVELVRVVQTFSPNRTDAYRAFAIDDPLFKGRTSAGSQWKSPEALAAFALTAFPGNPIIYYGSEIGMTSEDSATGSMQWTDLNNNTCVDQSSYMCFCNAICKGDSGSSNRTCPVDNLSQMHRASVREQIRDESNGLLKSVVQLLAARKNDSLIWGKSRLTVDPHSHKVLVAIRDADMFDKFGLFISLAAHDLKDEEVVPAELPADTCYQTVYSFLNGQTSSSNERRHFMHMVLKKNEVRLVRVFKSC